MSGNLENVYKMLIIMSGDELKSIVEDSLQKKGIGDLSSSAS